MARQTSSVPYGYEPEDRSKSPRGTLWIYDSFESFGMQQLAPLIGMGERKSLKKLVFYPLHEETLRRMGERNAEPYYRRTEALEELLEQAETPLDMTIDHWEGRRKKYTPVDTAFRYLAEKYAGPHFVWVTLETANKLAGYDSFEGWIKKIRLWIDMEGSSKNREAELHPRLHAAASRWDPVDEESQQQWLESAAHPSD
ncbi:hypothetical protein ACFQ88_27940 [Paenibacillus sp. NPDC056579]|uniref:hypothetical protein n=1 Tax=Paenibacillus sp. NPDC056579 TaxID=3345871 RepID=UPI003696AF51